eukprot:TRINITY_DN41084_c0_g1_i1.p1 TRINITY_DN41084_c0_g1~~TRINITY_DN41084_c0_g1_i1.p1  ORF type:complete len:147 (+),score=18.66 TRINITY_DN41084_c0_g1_i1:73-513(+)
MPPKAEKKPATSGMGAGKAPAKMSSSSASRDKKRSKKRTESYGRFINLVLKQVHPDNTTISKKAMAIMDSFVHDMFERIATEASKLAQYTKKSTIGYHEIEYALDLLLPGELARLAKREGKNAITKWAASIGSAPMGSQQSVTGKH